MATQSNYIPYPRHSDRDLIVVLPATNDVVVAPCFQTTEKWPTGQVLSSLENLDDRARLIVRRDGLLIAAGQRAIEMLNGFQGLSLHNGSLLVSGAEENASLCRLLATPGGSAETLVLGCPSDDGHLLVHATGIDDVAVAMAIQRAHDKFTPHLANLETAFGLTPAEMRVVELLLSGRSPTEICEQLDVSVHTVRTHLRHSYDKLGVSSREALWHKLAPYRLN